MALFKDPLSRPSDWNCSRQCMQNIACINVTVVCDLSANSFLQNETCCKRRFVSQAYYGMPCNSPFADFSSLLLMMAMIMVAVASTVMSLILFLLFAVLFCDHVNFKFTSKSLLSRGLGPMVAAIQRSCSPGPSDEMAS